MSDQTSGQETQKEGDPQQEPLAGRVRAAPVIEGEAVDVTPPEEKPQDAATAPEAEAPPEKPVQKSSVLKPLAALVGVVIIGAGSYVSWRHYVKHHAPAPVKIVEAPAKPETPPVVSEKKAAPESAAPPIASPAPVAPPVAVNSAPVEAKTPPAPEKIAPPTPAAPEAPREAQTTPVATPVAAATPVAVSPPTVEAKAPAAAEKIETPAPASTPAPETVKEASAQADATSELAARLAATQAALEQTTQRLQALEAKLAEPKTPTRAEIGDRDAGPAGKGEASTRLVLAQTLLATLRQGDDYASLLAALQANGGDPTHIEKLRAGLAAPDFKKLGSEFAALAPTIAAALAPAPEQKPVEASPPAGFVQSTLAYLQARAKQVVRVRPVGGVDETTARLERIGKDIDRRDLAAALSEIAILPEKARALASDWVKAAQTRLDAEDAAKAELADSVQGLSKSRS